MKAEKQHAYALFPFSFISLIKLFSSIQISIIQNATTPTKVYLFTGR